MYSLSDDPDEALRLTALRGYAVLDTPPEESLDDITALAAAICDTPIALITLIDEHRQWFKSKVGTEVSETPRELSFCEDALRQTGVLVVPDIAAEPRLATHPLVAGEPGLRFYAGAPLRTPEGQTLGTLCVLDFRPRQITPVHERALEVLSRQVMTQLELRRQSRQLGERERLLRAIFDSEPDCVKLLGPDGSLRMMNRAGLATIQASSFGEVAGRPVQPLLVPEDRPELKTLLTSVFQGGSEAMEYDLITLKGEQRSMEMRAVPLRNEAGEVTDALAITRDVTDRKAAEKALRESEQRFNLLAKATRDAIWDWDVVTNSVWWNEGLELLFGFHRDEVGPDLNFWVEQLHPNDRRRARERLQAAVQGGPSIYSDEYRFRRRDGSYAHVLDRGYVIRDAAGAPVRMIGAMTDLTERIEAERRIAEQAALIDQARDAFLVRDLEDRVTFWSKGAQALYGWKSEEVLGKRFDEVLKLDPAALEGARQSLQRYGLWSGELRKRTKAGALVMVDSRWTPLRDEELRAKGYLHIDTDITARKDLEQQFLRAQRVESIGTMAGGIAHDLNNSLGPIILSLDLLKARFPDHESQELLATIGSSAQRGADMVKQVLTFARGVESQRSEVRMGELVREVEKIANDTFLKSIQVSVTLPADLRTVSGDATQLHQVLVNLCLNARDAMPEGGTLTLTSRNLTLDEQYAAQRPDVSPGPYIAIVVEDTGTGMSAEVAARAFDPFFTTKEPGRGTGLGLSTSHAIVKSHGGFILLSSEDGRGTRVEVFLPALAESSAAEVPARRPDLPRGSGQLVLLIDDEAAVRKITQQTLETFGYQVVAAAGGTEAVTIFARQRGEIAVVLTDMMMPDIDGAATIRILRKMDPAVRIVATSGLASAGRVEKAAELGVQHFLRKPYTAEVLLKTLEQVLAE